MRDLCSGVDVPVSREGDLHAVGRPRWGVGGRGKRGGIRVIYYWQSPEALCLMLYVYTKHDQGDLTAARVKLLRLVVEEEFG